MGISGSLLSWFRSYLSTRSQRVVINESSLLHITAGVPQGSVLGPILFLVYINDLFDVIENNLDVFADDSTLWASIPPSADPDTLASHRASVAASLNHDLIRIEEWANKWLVTYNESKTELVTFSNKKDCANLDAMPHPPLLFRGIVIPESASFKIVGLHINRHLSWSKHVDSLAKNARHNLSLLYHSTNYLNKRALASIYVSHIRSRMEYLSPIWMGASETSLGKLDAIQKRATKIIGQKTSDRYVSQSLHHRRGVSSFCLAHRMLHKSAPLPIQSLCPPRIPAPASVDPDYPTLPSAPAPMHDPSKPPAVAKGMWICPFCFNTDAGRWMSPVKRRPGKDLHFCTGKGAIVAAPIAADPSATPNPHLPVLPSLIDPISSSLAWIKSTLPRLVQGWNSLSPSKQSISSLLSFKTNISRNIHMAGVWPLTVADNV